MAEEIDESGFYREDFSTESDWEVFNAQLGELFQKWELSNTDWGREFEEDELFQCDWNIQTEHLDLPTTKIAIKYYEALVKPHEQPILMESDNKIPLHCDLMSLRNTFGVPLNDRKELHPLSRLYGLRRFVVIQPHNVETQYFTRTYQFSFFLSAVTVVAAELCSSVPIFVQIYNPKWNFFLGVGMAPSLRTNFDLVALDQAPNDCRYLSGLLSMFKEKIPTTYLRPATVSVRSTYALETVHLNIPVRIPFAKTPSTEEDETIAINALRTSLFSALPHGYFRDSCTDMNVIYTWPEMIENVAIDSALRSDFVPSKAPCGIIRLVVHATSYLSSCIRDYQKLCGSTLTLESFLGRNFTGVNANLADTTRQSPKKLSGPMNENELTQMLLYLFPDMQTDATFFKYPKELFRPEVNPIRIKSAPSDSLVCRLSCLLATCNAHFGGKSGMAQLWATFTRQVRFYWESARIIPGVAPGFPDTRTCLLHQKLQMLNVCLERSEALVVPSKLTTTRKTFEDVKSEDEDEEDDEFFECEGATESSAGSNKPEGRQKALGDLKLLDSDESLYVPITQEPVPKTEDQLYSDAEVMLKLGPGSDVTTQMMCSSLLSDMEAFKAANPSAKMDDFIRWYSPRDWEESPDDEGKTVGKMSPRMTTPGNTWQTVWQQAQPVPAWRQKRLFDNTNEALKVFHYLDTRTDGEIYELTVISMLHSAVLKLQDICTSSSVQDIFSAQIEDILAELCRISRDINVIDRTESEVLSQLTHLEPIIQKIDTLEKQFYQFKCFEHISGYPDAVNLSDVKRQFREILKNGGSCNIVGRREGDPDGVLGSCLLHINLNDLQNNLVSKDYVIRVDGETTSAAKGQTGPQFLRAIVTGEQLRLCGAFTENTTFV